MRLAYVVLHKPYFKNCVVIGGTTESQDIAGLLLEGMATNFVTSVYRLGGGLLLVLPMAPPDDDPPPLPWS